MPRRDVPGFPGYQVDDHGLVYSCWGRGGRPRQRTDRWRPLARTRRPRRWTVHVRDDGGRVRTVAIAYLMLLAFQGPPRKTQVPRYRDGNGHNITLGNLSWGPAPLACFGAAARHGPDHHRARLTVDLVQELRRRARAGESLHSLARSVRVSRQAVTKAVRGDTYAWLDDESA
jgi:hypothetical protein